MNIIVDEASTPDADVVDTPNNGLCNVSLHIRHNTTAMHLCWKNQERANRPVLGVFLPCHTLATMAAEKQKANRHALNSCRQHKMA